LDAITDPGNDEEPVSGFASIQALIAIFYLTVLFNSFLQDLPEEIAQDEGKREIITREISIFRESMKVYILYLKIKLVPTILIYRHSKLMCKMPIKTNRFKKWVGRIRKQICRFWYGFWSFVAGLTIVLMMTIGFYPICID